MPHTRRMTEPSLTTQLVVGTVLLAAVVGGGAGYAVARHERPSVQSVAPPASRTVTLGDLPAGGLYPVPSGGCPSTFRLVTLPVESSRFPAVDANGDALDLTVALCELATGH